MTSYETLEDIFAKIEAWHDEHPWRSRLRSARRYVRHAPRRSYLSVKWAYQRVVRGWDDRAIWGLDSHLARTLGHQLLALARDTHSYPSSDWTFEQWQAELAQVGAELLSYAEVDYLVDDQAWEADHQAAQDALRWVADNLANLWD